MRIRQRSLIDRPPERVWSYVIRPEHFQTWNSKITALDATGEFRLGQTFTTRYKWNDKVITCVTVPTEISEAHVLELRHAHPTGVGVRPDMEVQERITLRGFGRRTIVTKIITIKNHGMPWFLIPVVWFVGNFGARVGPDPLKVLCERQP